MESFSIDHDGMPSDGAMQCTMDKKKCEHVVFFQAWHRNTVLYITLFLVVIQIGEKQQQQQQQDSLLLPS